MDEDRGDPARRRLSRPGGQGQGQDQPPSAPTDLFSQFQRRFSQSLFLPPMAPRLPSAASGSGSGSASSHYQGMPALALAAGAGGSHLTRSLSQPPFFSTDQLAPLSSQPPFFSTDQLAPLSSQPPFFSTDQLALLSQSPFFSTDQLAPLSQLPFFSTDQLTSLSQPPFISADQLAPLSQPPFFSTDQLAPLPQPPFISTDQLAPLPYAGPAVARSPLSPGAEQGSSALPPRGAGHRRSRSDFFFGFSHPNMSLPVPPTVDAAALDGVFGSYRDMGTLDSAVNGAKERNDYTRESSENEAEKWATVSGPSNPRHCRSLSVDSFMGNLNFEAMGQESPKLPPPSSAVGTSGGPSRTGSGPSGGPSALFATNPAQGEFSEADKKKIMASDHLAEMALTDPKRVKRVLANRVSAAKSKERRLKYMAELERRVRVLQMETSTLSEKVEREQRESNALRTQNNEMRIRVQALEKEAQLKNDLNEAMSAEVQHLKHAIGEAGDPRAPNGSHQQMDSQMTPQHLLQLQQKPSEAELDPQQQQE